MKKGMFLVLLGVSLLQASNHDQTTLTIDSDIVLVDSRQPLPLQQPDVEDQQVPQTPAKVKVAIIAGAFGIATSLLTSLVTLIVHFTKC